MYEVNKKEYQRRRKDALDKWVEIHWWNMRSKTLEFKGKISDCLKNRNITIRLVGNHYHITNICGGMYCKTTIPYTDPWNYGFISMIADQILMQLNYLGDKSQVAIGGRIFKNKKW